MASRADNRGFKFKRRPAHLFRRDPVDPCGMMEAPPPAFRLLNDPPPPPPPPPRPSSAFAATNSPRPLSNIPEGLGSAGDGSTQVNRGPTPGTEARDVAPAPLQPTRSHAASSVSLPRSSLPERRSSRTRVVRMSSRRSTSSFDIPPLAPPPPDGHGHTVPGRGPSTSPVRSAAARLDPLPSDMHRTASRTFVRPIRPLDMLEVPELGHARVSLETRVTAPLFMGGGTVEGQIALQFDGGSATSRRKPRPAMSIGRIAVDVLGVEAVRGRQHIFRSLAVELVDEDHPPPSTMAVASRARFDALWEVQPSRSVLPFRVNLPIHMGPPPYRSKHASIRYVLCATVAISIAGKVHHVRQSHEIAVMTVHDPEKALVNLSHPLTASDDMRFSKFGTHDVIMLTAGVHRQTWVSGTAIFVDAHISNRSRKTVKKIELRLERATTFYDHAAASTNVEVATHLRLPDRTVKEVLAKRSTRKARHGWPGILPQSQDVGTYFVDIPPGLATIDTGRFFGVRFFLSVHVSCTTSKRLSVQIPVTIIHPNSLDIVPNSVAQVASAINNRHHRRPRSVASHVGPSTGSPTRSSGGRRSPYRYSYTQGRAFSAARRRSIEHLHRAALQADELADLTERLDGSPRKAGPNGQAVRVRRAKSSLGSHGVKENLKSRRSSYSLSGVSAPRLMRSTSGLGFDGGSSVESEGDEIGEDGFFHGMYRRQRSVQDRDDAKVQREVAEAGRRSVDEGDGGWAWRNVAVEGASEAKSWL